MNYFVTKSNYQNQTPLSEMANGFGNNGVLASFTDGQRDYTLECLTDIDVVESNKEEWEALEQSSGQPFIYFQSFDWCHKWCKTFANLHDTSGQLEIKIYVLRSEGALVMIWPMMVTRHFSGFKNLTFLTVPHGQYSNIVCDREQVSLEVGIRVWKDIRKFSKADAVTLDQYPKNSFLREIIDGDGIIEQSNHYASILDLDAFETWEQHQSEICSKIKKQRNRKMKKLARMGNVDFEIHMGGTEQYHALTRTALGWKNQWLEQTGRRTNVISQEKTQEFLLSLSGKKATDDTMLSGAVIGVLKLNGIPIGIEIGMCLDGHYYSYLGAFDWEYRKYSPGKIQIEYSQAWAKNVGLNSFDFLGDPADYKSFWSNKKHMLESRTVPQSIRGYIYCAVWKSFLRPKLRSIFNRLDSKNRSRILDLLPN